MLSPTVRELAFERLDGAPVVFDAGQWVNLVLPVQTEGGIGEIRRSYSVASCADGTPRFELAVTRVDGGPGSTYLHTIEEGTTLKVVGPQGFFTRPLESAGPSLFIGTGTGVTPLRSMIRAAIAAGRRDPLCLLFGVRREEDILYREELEALAREHDFFRVVFSLSRPHDDWAAGRRGYVQTHVRELWTELEQLGKGTPHTYICGLQRMVGSVRELLRKEMNLPRQVVHSERYD
jgi:ferredoxin-NADP reductase